MNGFYGRYIRIDLTQKSFSVEPLDDEVLIRDGGGKGLAGLNPPGVDPLAPEKIVGTPPIRLSSSKHYKPKNRGALLANEAGPSTAPNYGF